MRLNNKYKNKNYLVAIYEYGLHSNTVYKKMPNALKQTSGIIGIAVSLPYFG